MRLMGMRFKDFTWKDNPVSLRVAHARRVGEVNVPYGESKAEELGPQRRNVTGEGYFAGEDCMEAWAGLQRAFSQKGPGLLQLPGVEPFWALMDSLELVGTGRHIFSHIEWHMTAFTAQLEEHLLPEGWVWADRNDLAQSYAVPNAFQAFSEYVKGRLGYFS